MDRRRSLVDCARAIDGRRCFDYKRSCRYAGSSMTRHLAQLNRFFVSPHFSVYYRRAKQLVWQSQATSGYSLLATLNGQVEYTFDGKSIPLPSSESVILEPNTSVAARGQQV